MVRRVARFHAVIHIFLTRLCKTVLKKCVQLRVSRKFAERKIDVHLIKANCYITPGRKTVWNNPNLFAFHHHHAASVIGTLADVVLILWNVGKRAFQPAKNDAGLFMIHSSKILFGVSD